MELRKTDIKAKMHAVYNRLIRESSLLELMTLAAVELEERPRTRTPVFWSEVFSIISELVDKNREDISELESYFDRPEEIK
jgi:hypothetical protein